MKNLQDRIERLIDSLNDPKKTDELAFVRDQVASFRSEYQAAVKENHRIVAENMGLMSKNRLLTQRIEQLIANAQPTGTPAAPEAPPELIDHLGLLFCRRPGGRFDRAVYCPKCRKMMRTVSPALPMTCSNCRVSTPFKAAELNDVIVQLGQG